MSSQNSSSQADVDFHHSLYGYRLPRPWCPGCDIRTRLVGLEFFAPQFANQISVSVSLICPLFLSRRFRDF